MLSPIEEIRFWTGIMRDHGEFILSSLSYNEYEAINSAHFFKEIFMRLHEQSKKLTNDENAVNSISYECIRVLLNFINFKRIMLGRLLKCELNTSLPPTFYNHMINEAMEFYETLISISCKSAHNPLLEILKLHRTWLPDAAGHAAIIASDLDPTEKLTIIEAQEFEKCFNHLVLKSDELGKMLVRTCLNNGALEYFNQEVIMKIEEFICYLDKLKKLKAQCKVLGILKLLTPDHMIREEKHYLSEIAKFCPNV